MKTLKLEITEMWAGYWVAKIGEQVWATSHDLQGILNNLNDYAADMEKEMKS